MIKLLLAAGVVSLLTACAGGTYGSADRTGGASTPSVGVQGGGGPRGSSGGGPG